jgi:hypothetical protein
LIFLNNQRSISWSFESVFKRPIVTNVLLHCIASSSSTLTGLASHRLQD